MQAWARGRRVAIFPDVPGRFRPGDSIIITTSKLRETLHSVVRDITKPSDTQEQAEKRM